MNPEKLTPERQAEIRVKTQNNSFGPEWAERALHDLMKHILALEQEILGCNPKPAASDQLPTTVPFHTD